MLLLVGLGNPGPRHELNRHNIGFMAVDAIARVHGFDSWRSRFRGQTAEGRIGSEKVLLLKPQTFMNLSGQSVGEAVRFFKLPSKDVTVFYDEIDLAAGKIKVKQGGGHAGHNGLRDIDRHIEKDYWRVRLGVGRPREKSQVKNYVLQDFSKAERKDWLDALVDAVASEVPALVEGDEGRFMSRVSYKVFPPPPKPPKEQAVSGDTDRLNSDKQES
jgi:PTH1 family peptidyl-tRNA hydrolase